MFLLLTASQGHAQSQPPLGLWASELGFGRELHGKLIVERKGSEWIARLGSVEARFKPNGDSVRFAFPAELGQFRGAFTADRSAIHGWWIQPEDQSVPFMGDPGSLGQTFTTKLTLRLEQPNVWSGEVVPLENRYTLYLSIWKAPSGKTGAAFRNPERNHRGGSAVFYARMEGDSLVLFVPGDSTEPEFRRTAYFDQKTKQITIFWPALNRYMVLAPRPEDQAASLFPRLPRGLKYSYAEPLPESDGWRSTRASAVGMDESKLASLVQSIADTMPTLGRAPFIHSLLIARHGKIVLEEYFAGYERARPHDTRSVGKTFASVMLGALMYEGNKVRPETRITDLLPSLRPFANSDPRKNQITLAHLMTHSSGLACDDDDDESPGQENRMQRQSVRNWWKYMLDLPMTHNPGEWYAYCSGGSNLVGAAVATAAKTWLPEVFDRTIARPLQFHRYYYNLMPTGEGYTGGGVYMRPRDLLKVGQLFLDSGVWNGKRIVSKQWVALSTTKHIQWPRRNENVSEGQDGYMWHLNDVKVGNRLYREFEANGNGGQLLMVYPELDLVVVFTAGNYSNGGVWSMFRDDLIVNRIIPAIRDR